MVFICIFLMISDTSTLYRYWPSVCLFWKNMSTQVLCPFFNWIACYCWVIWITYIFWIETLISKTPKIYCINFLLSGRFLLILLMYRAFKFDIVLVVCFCFCRLCFWCQFWKIITTETSLTVWWFRLHVSNAEGIDSVPGRGTKIPHVICSIAQKNHHLDWCQGPYHLFCLLEVLRFQELQSSLYSELIFVIFFCMVSSV